MKFNLSFYPDVIPGIGKIPVSLPPDQTNPASPQKLITPKQPLYSHARYRKVNTHRTDSAKGA